MREATLRDTFVVSFGSVSVLSVLIFSGIITSNVAVGLMTVLLIAATCVTVMTVDRFIFLRRTSREDPAGKPAAAVKKPNSTAGRAA